jgi:hypothetical protein
MIDDFLREFDELALDVFAEQKMGAGVGDYTSPAGSVTEGVRVYFNRTQVAIGEFQQQSIPAVTVGYFLADTSPEADGAIAIGAESWINERELSNDGSISTWIVRHG